MKGLPWEPVQGIRNNKPNTSYTPMGPASASVAQCLPLMALAELQERGGGESERICVALHWRLEPEGGRRLHLGQHWVPEIPYGLKNQDQNRTPQGLRDWRDRLLGSICHRHQNRSQALWARNPSGSDMDATEETPSRRWITISGEGSGVGTGNQKLRLGWVLFA